MDPLRWRRLDSELRYDGFTRIRRDTYELPDGTVSEWDVHTQGDTVAVIAFTADGAVVLFEQFRVGPARALIEVPGGLIDAGESPLEAGARELEEETGYRAVSLFHAGSEFSGANSTRRKHVLIAADAVRIGDPRWGASEMGVVRTLDPSAFIDHLLAGDLSDAGESLRGLHAFARASQLDGHLAALQIRVRELLTASLAAPAASRASAADPIDEFWANVDGRTPDDLRRGLAEALQDRSAADPVALYERASLHDFLGEESAAVPLYRAALDGGLDGARRTCCLIQLASSLRNVGDAPAALSTLDEVDHDDPLAAAAEAFRALAESDDGHADLALRTALRALAPHLPHYGRAITAYADELTARDATSTPASSAVEDVV